MTGYANNWEMVEAIKSRELSMSAFWDRKNGGLFAFGESDFWRNMDKAPKHAQYGVVCYGRGKNENGQGYPDGEVVSIWYAQTGLDAALVDAYKRTVRACSHYVDVTLERI